MPKTVVASSPFMKVYYEPETKIVSHEILQYASGQPLHEGLMAGVEALKKNKAHKWLSDDRNNGALSKEDQEWVNNVWIKQAIAAGWKSWALVMPASVIGQHNMKRFCEEFAQLGVTVKTFSDPALALTWLKSA